MVTTLHSEGVNIWSRKGHDDALKWLFTANNWASIDQLKDGLVATGSSACFGLEQASVAPVRAPIFCLGDERFNSVSLSWVYTIYLLISRKLGFFLNTPDHHHLPAFSYHGGEESLERDERSQAY